MWYLLGRAVVWLFFKIFFNFRVIGRENIPKKGAFIIACNHLSFLDPPLVGVGLPWRKSLNLRYMAKAELFRNKAFGRLLRSYNVFSLGKIGYDTSGIREAIRILNEGKGLVVFPEGTRSQDGQLHEGASGAGFLAAKTKAVVVPAFVKGTELALPRQARFIRLKHIEIRFGKPLYPKDYLATHEKDYKRVTDKIMDAIRRLSKEQDVYKGS